MRTWCGWKAVVGAILLLVFVVAIGAQKAPKSAEALYQEALLKKDADGDLESAIALLTRILKEFPAARNVAGLAQLQIGVCYEKLGLAKAEEAYRKVLTDFADQPEAVRTARERLSRMEGSPRLPAPDDGLVLRKMTIPEGLISPDGKYVATDDLPEMDGIAIYNIQTGKTQTVAKSSENGSCCFWLHGWTPSSDRIIFENSQLAAQTEELRIVDVDGRNERLVRRFEGFGILDGGGFSPDAKAYFVLLERTDRSEAVIGRVDVTDGTFAEVKNLGPVHPTKLCPSPDGEFLVYDTSRYAGLADADVHILRSDGRDERPLLTGPHAENILGWMPDNRGIIFTSTRSGELALWALALKNGQPAGEPVFIKGIKGYIASCSFTRAGAFYFSENAGGQDVYYAQIDFKSGTSSSEPRRVEPVFPGRSRTPFWSPDGRSLGYIFLTSQDEDPLCQFFLKIYSPASEKTKDILLDFKPDRYIFANGWTTDGRAILLRGAAAGRRGLWRVDTENGESRLISESDKIIAWSGDGKIMFETPGDVGDPNKRVYRLVRRDLSTGAVRDIFKGKPGEVIYWVSVSPDAKMIGFKIYNRTDRLADSPLIIMPEAGGAEIARIAADFGLDYWAPRDFGGIVHLKRFSDQKPNEIWYYPLDHSTAERQLRFSPDPGWLDIVFSPDGRAMAYSSAREFETTFWSVENFLPAKDDKMRP
jgi:Tol biopolymer transport system component